MRPAEAAGGTVKKVYSTINLLSYFLHGSLQKALKM